MLIMSKKAIHPAPSVVYILQNVHRMLYFSRLPDDVTLYQQYG